MRLCAIEDPLFHVFSCQAVFFRRADWGLSMNINELVVGLA